MEFSAAQIAALLNGKIEGDSEVKISNVAKIEEGKKGTLSFLANPKYTPYIYTTDSSIVIVNNDFEPTQTIKATLIRVEDAYEAFARLLEIYQQMQSDKKGISSLAFSAGSAQLGQNIYLGEFAFIGENSIIGDNTKIYPQVYIGDNCQIGENTIIYPGVKIYQGTKIGNNCIIHAGSVIGSDGFGFAEQTDKHYKKIPQTGIVIIEDDVEIGANTTIDRATLGATLVKKGVKLDNLIQIAHNVEVGENTVMAAQVGISGSTKVGANCMFGGQVGLAGHINIADEVKIAAQSGISSHIHEKAAVVMGSPAIPFRDYRRILVHFKNLNQIVERIAKLEKQLNSLSDNSADI